MLLSTLVLCSARCLFVILRERRVRARPASDSDPVRRHGPERGSTRGGGRPRSFPSGPPFANQIAGQSGGYGRRGQPVGPSPPRLSVRGSFTLAAWPRHAWESTG